MLSSNMQFFLILIAENAKEQERKDSEKELMIFVGKAGKPLVKKPTEEVWKGGKFGMQS